MDLVLHVANETYLTLHDPRHNLLSIADSTGTVAAGNSLRYEPFGTPSVGATTSGIEPRFGGMRYLPGTQLYLSDTRLMDPRHGAWLSPDPLGYVDSPNLYAYARQNPIDFVDPSGLGTKKGKPGKNSDGGDIFDWFADAKETLAEGVEGLLEAAEDSFNFYKGLVTSEEFTGFWRGFGKRSLELAGVTMYSMGARTPWTTQMMANESEQTWQGMKAGAELFTTAWDASWGDESAELRRQEMVGAIVNNFATMSPEEWGSMAPDVLLGVGTGGAGVGRAVSSTGARVLRRGISRVSGGYLFRGTTLGYSGRYPVTFTSTDPGVATAFSASKREFGEAVVEIVRRKDVQNIPELPSSSATLKNVEAEVILDMSPAEFSRLARSVPVDDARQALKRLGVEVPRNIHGQQQLNNMLPQLDKMTPRQIRKFVRRVQ